MPVAYHRCHPNHQHPASPSSSGYAMRINRTQTKRQRRSVYARLASAVAASLALVIFTVNLHHVSASRIQDQVQSSNSCSAATPSSDDQYNEPLQLWRSKQVDRVPFAEMTSSRMNKFLRRRRPVVIVGAYAHSNLTQGVNEQECGWEGMKRRFGHVELTTVVRGMERSNRCQGTGLWRDGTSLFETCWMSTS